MAGRRRPEPHGPLAGHLRDGRRYYSSLAALDAFRLADWVRDDLPDLLWPLLVMAETGNEGALSFVRWQEDVFNKLRGTVDPQLLADGLDGRLTSLDRLVDAAPDAKPTIVGFAASRGLLPGSVQKVLASYPFSPAAWLHGLEVAPPGQAEVELCAKAVREVLLDEHREALVKCLWIWAAVQAGTFRTDQEFVELLQPYPNDVATRSKADSVIRASWLAARGMNFDEDPSRSELATNWAKVFWGANSMTSRCIRKRDLTEVATTGVHDVDQDADTAGVAADNGDHLQQLAMDLVASYVEALETSPARLYDQERQEVHSGLVCRAGREVITVLGAKDLWSAEHGSHVTRALIEIRIYIAWMAQQDPSIYAQFQAYGAGKAKLYKRILDEVVHETRRADIDEAMAELERLSHNDGPLDHRIVDTADSFADGKSIRAMAQECGLLDFYRQGYSISSGVAHSEWWSVETHCMERCMNVLHRLHLIPSLSLNSGGSVEMAQAWVDQLLVLIRESLRILGTPEASVQGAFGWLTDEGATDAPSD